MKVLGICIISNDVPRLTEFYCNILNTTFDGDDNHAEIQTNGAGITIFSVEGMEEMAPGSMANAGSGNFTLGISVDNIEDSFTRIKETGISIVKELQTHPWGNASFWFRDPEGNIVNFVGKAKSSV